MDAPHDSCTLQTSSTESAFGASADSNHKAELMIAANIYAIQASA